MNYEDETAFDPHAQGLPSLRIRLSRWMGVLLAQSLLLIIIVTFFFYFYQSSHAVAMSNCYRVNGLITSFMEETERFDNYLTHPMQADGEAYDLALARTRGALDVLHFDMATEEEQYLLARAAHVAHERYAQACAQVIADNLAGALRSDAYESVVAIGQYVQQYSLELERLTIALGNSEYNRYNQLFSFIPFLLLFMAFFSLACIMLWSRWTMRYLLSPVMELTRAARAMTVKRYDIPDIEITSSAEMHCLATAFNQLKQYAAQLIHSLETQRELTTRLHTEELNRIQMESKMNSMRLSLLHAQINPHFLFNTLNIISRMAQIEDAKRTEELIQRLARLFRYNLQSVENVVPLRDELKIINDYMTIQQIRFGRRVSWRVACTVDPDRSYIPVFTLQPLVENAIIHGISPKEDGGEVTVDISPEDGGYRVVVADTGVGIEPERLTQLLAAPDNPRGHLSGLGLSNVRARILLHFPGSSFETTSQCGQGTTITIHVRSVPTDACEE